MRPFTLGFVLLGAAVAAAHVAGQTSTASPAPAMTVYKSPTCGCCSKWIDHMRANGFVVTAVDVDDVEVPMRTYGVPVSLGSCHTAIVNGYVVEGHVPADVVSRMLREKPAIAGISAPGMPAGSPGMEMGDYKQPYSIISFDKTGKTAVYDRR